MIKKNFGLYSFLLTLFILIILELYAYGMNYSLRPRIAMTFAILLALFMILTLIIIRANYLRRKNTKLRSVFTYLLLVVLIVLNVYVAFAYIITLPEEKEVYSNSGKYLEIYSYYTQSTSKYEDYNLFFIKSRD